MSSPLFFLLLLFPDLEKTQFVPKWMFISFSQGNKKLNTDILLERKIFRLTSEKHLQVAAGKAKEMQSLFAAATTPLPVAQGWETSSAWKSPMTSTFPEPGRGGQLQQPCWEHVMLQGEGMKKLQSKNPDS